MKKIYLSLVIIFSFTLLNAAEKKCNSALSKLKPECNFFGKGVEKMKNFSKKNKTINQSIDNVKEKLKKQ